MDHYTFSRVPLSASDKEDVAERKMLYTTTGQILENLFSLSAIDYCHPSFEVWKDNYVEVLPFPEFIHLQNLSIDGYLTSVIRSRSSQDEECGIVRYDSGCVIPKEHEAVLKVRNFLVDRWSRYSASSPISRNELRKSTISFQSKHESKYWLLSCDMVSQCLETQSHYHVTIWRGIMMALCLYNVVGIAQ
jgi:hypothetical protein